MKDKNNELKDMILDLNKEFEDYKKKLINNKDAYDLLKA